MASGVYNQFKTEIMNGTFDLPADSIICNLMTATHAFTVANLGWASVSANQITGPGYPNGDSNVLQAVTVTQDDIDNEGVFDAQDISWTSATFTARHAVIYDDTPTSPADPLICSIDFQSDQSVSNGTFTIVWDAEGIVNIG